METTENITELFYTKLKTTTNPGVVLSQFYGILMGIQVGRSEIIAINRLIKIFGKFSVFMAILDVSRRDSYDEFPFGLLFKICRDRVEASIGSEMTAASAQNLEKLLLDMEKDILQVKPVDPGKATTKFLSRKEDE